MRSKVFEQVSKGFLVGLFTFYFATNLFPIWASLVVALTASFVTVVNWENSGCSTVFAIPFVMASVIFTVGILKYDFTTALLMCFSAILILLVYNAERFVSVLAMIGLGLYLTFASSHSPIVDALIFTLLVLSWYLIKVKRLNVKTLLWILIASTLVIILASDVNLYPFRTFLSSLTSSKQAKEQRLQVEKETSFGGESISQQPVETKQTWLNKIIEKIWIPLILLLSAIFLFTFSITNFGIKGTFKMLLLGALLFTAFVAVTSMVLRSVKPKFDLPPLGQAYSISLEGEQIVERKVVERHESVEKVSEKTHYNLALFLDFLTLIILAFMTVLIVLYILKVRQQLLVPKQEKVQEEKIPQDVELYPLDKIPDFEPTEKFVKSAYWWLRRKYFSNLHHLTPRELLMVTNLNIPAFEELTFIYEKVRYAGKPILEDEAKRFYLDLLEIVNEIEKQSVAQTHQENLQGA
ncbi:DUF4129 domain-containing protein [Pseudothermotoga thermarum]|uniref:DUF4129 domain-containing protein n=1 Tax=Pseudothermotoga thermarum DSM 5069 TaxID=688269 RepID=F7YVI4_9THEM|nr:DUF4129 domain-containing protein [Pseudothermotoga thermarum]AEH51639.1 hypothetical protein Theth_1586 [Pseudothermotoga thermarum DSM 5069]